MLARLKDPTDRIRLKKGNSRRLAGLVQPLHCRRRRLVANVNQRQGKLRRADDGPHPRCKEQRKKSHSRCTRPDVRHADRGERLHTDGLRASHREGHEPGAEQPWCSIGSDGSAYCHRGRFARGNPHPRNFGTFPRVWESMFASVIC